MKIWKLRPGGRGYGFEIIPDDYDVFYLFGDHRFEGNWPEIKLHRRVLKGHEKVYADAMYLSMRLILFKRQVVDKLQEFFDYPCEAVPCRYGREEFYLLNTPNIMGCSHRKDHASYYTSTYKGTVNCGEFTCGIDQFEFDLERIEGHHLFQDKKQFSSIYCSDAFKEAYEKAGFRDLQFFEVFDSENTGKMDCVRLIRDTLRIVCPEFADSTLVIRKYDNPSPKFANHYYLTCTLPGPNAEKNAESSEENLSQYSSEDCYVALVALSQELLAPWISECETPMNFQALWYFDGNCIDIVCYLTNEIEEYKYVLTAESTYAAQIEKWYNAFKHGYSNTNEDVFYHLYENELQRLCLDISDHISATCKEVIREIIPPDFYS